MQPQNILMDGLEDRKGAFRKQGASSAHILILIPLM
jgi:hypothetical protein